MDNLKIILEEFEKYKGQFVISERNKVVRFISLLEDEYDYYYMLYDGKKIILESCVGRIIPLKGYLREEDYKHLIGCAELNDNDQIIDNGIEKIKEDIQKQISDYKGKNNFLTEICLELN